MLSTVPGRAPRAVVVALLPVVGAMLASAGQASATIDPNETDRPKISAGDRDFGNNLFAGAPLNGGIVNWDVTPHPPEYAHDRTNYCDVVTPWVSGQLYVNNLAWESTRVSVLYHDHSHGLLYPWHSPTFTPVDNKSHQYTISDSAYGDSDVDHIVIQIEKSVNGTWTAVGSAVEYGPTCQI